MWRRLKAPLPGPSGARIGRHISEVVTVHAHLLTTERTGYPIGRDAGWCPRRLERASQFWSFPSGRSQEVFRGEGQTEA